MVKRTKLIVLFILFLSSCTQHKGNHLLYEQLFRQEGVDAYHVPIGLCEDYPEETTTLEIIRHDFELLKRTGVNLLRISFGWDAIEAEKDQYDWLFWDEFVRMAVDDYGITLIPYICYTPKWNSTCGQDTLYFWDYPPKDFDEFGEFMKDIVNRFKDRIKSWELWNEPDISIYWRGTVEEYAELVKIGSRAVREADPEAIVVLGGIAYDPEFIKTLFRTHGLSPFVDVVNCHNYFETWNPSPIEHIVDYIREIDDVIRSYGDEQVIWMAEVGYSTYRSGTLVSEIYSAYYDYEHTLEYQAVDLFKRLSLILSVNKLSAVAWYEIKDLPQTEEVIGDEYNNRHLGIADSDHIGKPAEKALVFFRQLFSMPVRSITEQIGVKKQPDSDSVVIGFEKEDGSIILVSWLQTNVPEKRPTKPKNLVKDHRKEVLDLSIPKALSGEVILYDEIGNRSIIKTVVRQDERTVINQLSLIGGAISIVEIKK